MTSLGAYAENMYLAPREAAHSALGPSLYATTIIYFVVATLLQYVYGQVFTTLAAVEDPNPDIYTRIDSHVAGENPVSDVGKKPVTSSPGSTIGYLQSRGGFLSCFRGFGLYLFIIVAGILVVLPFCLLGSIGYMLGSLVAMPILSNFHVLWVQVVVSKPSTKSLWSRIPPFRKTWAKISSAVFVRTVAAQVVAWIATPITRTVFTDPLPNNDNIYKYAFSKIGLLSLGLILYVLIQMPAEAIFLRVAASMLPDDEEAIIPFDRTFGGKVIPEVLGGSGKLGIVDAWRSFNRESQVLVMKAVGWNFGIQVALLFTFAIIFILEIVIL